MNLLQFVPVKLSIFLILGILLGEFGQPPLHLCLGTAFCALILLGYFSFRKKRRSTSLYGVIVAVAMTALGSATVGLERSKSYYHQLTSEQLISHHIWEMEIREVLKPTTYYHRYVAEVRRINSQKTSGLILCKLPLSSVDKELNIDHRIRITARAEEIAAPLNPYQFNYRNYMSGLGIWQQIHLKEGSFQSSEPERRSIAGYAAGFRQQISQSLAMHDFGPDELAIIKALLLGQRHELSSDVFGNYRDAGAIHILAISGLHIGIILMLLQFILKPLDFIRHGRKISLLLTVVLLWGFAILAGFSASVVRAVTMFSFLAYALYLNRPGNSFNILALSIFFILLLINPLLLFQPGFQLSYTAVFSILWIYPRLQRIWKPGNIFLRKLWELFCVGLAAQMGVLPMSLYYFHQFPGLFFLSNMIVVPFLGIILAGGIVVIVLSLLGILPALFISAYNTLIAAMNSLIAWIARQEVFLFTEIYFDPVFLLFSYLLLILIIRTMNDPAPKKFFAVLGTIMAMQFWNIGMLYRSIKQEDLNIIHQIGKTVLFYQKNRALEVLSREHEGLDFLIRDYKTAKRIQSVCRDSLRNAYIAGKKKLLVLDDARLLQDSVPEADIILLSESVKVNLDRVLKRYKPELIIADGSNYKSYTERWKRSCKKLGVPFYNTTEKGALRIDFP